MVLERLTDRQPYAAAHDAVLYRKEAKCVSHLLGDADEARRRRGQIVAEDASAFHGGRVVAFFTGIDWMREQFLTSQRWGGYNGSCQGMRWREGSGR